ncbi:MAG: universal stress protein [Blastocatellia bacterium]|nr:universal stress protein [Blastocatellia bacterium]
MYPFKNILFSTDFSPLSRSLLKYAAAFARHHNARLYLHNAQEGSLPPQVFRLSERALSEHGYEWLVAVRQELDELAQNELVKGLDVHILLTEGVAANEIVRVAQEHQIDLAMIATQRRGRFERTVLGSTTETVLAKINCPVFVSRQPVKDFVYYRGSETTIALNRILFATDFKPFDNNARDLALQLAATHGSKMIFMHAIGTFMGYIRSVSLTETEDMEGRIREDATNRLQKLAADAPGTDSEVVLREGRTYDEILEVQKETDADLIVVGTGDRHRGNPLGNNAERVIRNANCPVLVVPS